MSQSLAGGNGQRGWTGSTTLAPSNTFNAPVAKPITRDEQLICKEVEDEFKRRGHFKRIFPTMEYHYYKQFFLQGERPLNKMIDERVMEKRRLRTAAALM